MGLMRSEEAAHNINRPFWSAIPFNFELLPHLFVITEGKVPMEINGISFRGLTGSKCSFGNKCKYIFVIFSGSLPPLFPQSILYGQSTTLSQEAVIDVPEIILN